MLGHEFQDPFDTALEKVGLTIIHPSSLLKRDYEQMVGIRHSLNRGEELSAHRASSFAVYLDITISMQSPTIRQQYDGGLV